MALLKTLFGGGGAKPASPPAHVLPLIQGYVDARSPRHVAGWARNLDNPAQKLTVEAVLDGVVLVRAEAALFSRTLVAVGVGDGHFAFHAEFPRVLSDAEAARVSARVLGVALELAPALVTEYRPWEIAGRRVQGYVDARSPHHVAGWARDLDDATDKLEVEIIRDDASGVRVLQRAVASRFSRTLLEVGVGDGVHAFEARFDPPLDPATLDRVFVRAAGTTLELAPGLVTEFQPVAHLAMDIVNNCNLRCPFCVVDYANTRTTKFMSDETFTAAMRLLPFVTDGNFWLSCLHEATLHPELVAFIERVPREYRRKLFYTTNLAKRMPDSYFAAVAASGMHHINISIESFVPAIYEKMRKGARFPIFMENWEKLLAALPGGSAPPPLRYNVMCYRSNLHEIPSLVQTLLDEKRAWQVELRHTYDVAHVPDSFRGEEYLTTEEWAWLKAQLAHHDPARVLLLLPPGEIGYDPRTWEAPVADGENDDPQFRPPGGALNRAARPFNISMNWEGTMRVYGWEQQGPGRPDRFVTYAKTNIHFLPDPLRFLEAL